MIYWADSRSQAVRDGDWKLIRRETAELYNLAEDPYETTDLAARRPEILERLSAELSRQQALDAP